MSDQNKLTAEEIVAQYSYYAEGRQVLQHDSGVDACEEYAAKQTAEKDTEISTLRDNLKIAYSLLQGFPIAEPGDFGIGGNHHDWYCNRCNFLDSQGQSGIGVINPFAEKDAQIKELEEDGKKLVEMADKWLNGQAEALLKCDDLTKELEAVKRDKDYLFKRLEETKDERDEAVKLLQEVYQKMMSKRGENRMPTHQKVADYLSRLSSGDTKPEKLLCTNCTSEQVTPYGTTLRYYCLNCEKEFGPETNLSNSSNSTFKWECYEIHTVQARMYGCSTQCNECKEKEIKINKI